MQQSAAHAYKISPTSLLCILSEMDDDASWKAQLLSDQEIEVLVVQVHKYVKHLNKSVTERKHIWEVIANNVSTVGVAVHTARNILASGSNTI